MAKITNKQTAPSNKSVLTGAQLAIRANAVSVGELDYSEAVGTVTLEFGVLFTTNDVEEFRVCRADWLAGYADATGCEAVSAVVRFNEMMRAANVVKPQTEKAKTEVARRAAAKSATSAAIVKASDATAPADTEKSASAKSAGANVKMELSSIEAHIVGMLRAGKFTLAAQAIAQMAEKTALV